MDRTVHDCSTMIVPYDCICTVSEDVYSKVPEWSHVVQQGPCDISLYHLNCLVTATSAKGNIILRLCHRVETFRMQGTQQIWWQ